MLLVLKVETAALRRFSATAFSPKVLPTLYQIRHFSTSDLGVENGHKYELLRRYEKNVYATLPSQPRHRRLHETEPQLVCKRCKKTTDVVTKSGSPATEEETSVFMLSDKKNVYFLPANELDLEESCSDVVEFQVGSEKFTVSQSVLGPNFLETRLAQEIKTQWDGPHSTVKLSYQDATYFPFVLDYLRDGKVSLPPGIVKDSFQDALKALDIPIRTESILEPETISSLILEVLGILHERFHEKNPPRKG